MDYHVVSNSVEKTLQEKDKKELDTKQNRSGLKLKSKLKLKAKLKYKTFHLSQKYLVLNRRAASGEFYFRFIPLKTFEPF